MQIRLTGSAGSLTLDEGDIIASSGVDVKKTHTGVGDFRISVTARKQRALENFAARQDQILIDVESGTEFIGYVTNVSSDVERGTTILRGSGIAKRLEETRPEYDNLGGSLTYSNIAVEDAIRDYWSRTPFDTFTVYDQPTETVGTDQQIQSAVTAAEWDDITDIPDNVPLEAAGGVLQTLQNCNTLDAEDEQNTGSVVTNGDFNADFSEAEAVELSGDGEGVTFEANIEYNIPQFELAYQFRLLEQNLDSGVVIEFENEVRASISRDGENNNLAWRFQGALNETDISPGLYEVTIRLSNYTSGSLVVDVGAFYDTRYPPPSFDNTTNSFGALEEPGEYPESISTTLAQAETAFNITEATVTLTETSNEPIDAIEISFDGGSSFLSSFDTLQFTTSPNDPTRLVQTRLTLSGYTGNETTTPANRDSSHEIDTYELLVDLNDLTVIDELNLSQDHFTNLQTLHDYGDYLWNIEHDDKDIANLTVESFERGNQTRSLNVSRKIAQNAQIAADAYYNEIFLQGALVGSNRPTALVQDFTAISNDGREISPGVLRDLDVVTEAGADFRAQALLDRAQKNNALRGTQTYPADLSIQPGYAYSVDFGEGEQEFTLEELSLTYNGSDATVTLDFVPEQSLAEDISELRRASRQQSDRV